MIATILSFIGAVLAIWLGFAVLMAILGLILKPFLWLLTAFDRPSKPEPRVRPMATPETPEERAERRDREHNDRVRDAEIKAGQWD